MEIAVQEFTGYSSFDNNHVYDLVVSLRIMKTETDVRTPDALVIAGVTHMLERALVLQGLALVGHPSAAAFEVVVAHVGGLIDATRDESKENMATYERKCGELQESVDALVAVNEGLGERVGGLIRQYNDVMGLNEKLHVEVVELKAELDLRSER